jgi:prolipoprotein diacylglyceryltransferase
MISGKLILYVSIGTIMMLIPIVIQSYWYRYRLWKSFLIAFLIAISGVIGTYTMFYIENHRWGGTSFFGGVFFVPLFFIGFAYLLKHPYNELMDLCAPAGCMMLVVMKIQCLLSGCCDGRILFTDAAGTEVRFPSQMAELINGLILAAVLLYIAYKAKHKGEIYPIFLVLYGVSRFILSFFREDFVTTTMLVPFGTIWSIVAIIIGVLWMWLLRRPKEKEISEE